MADEKYSNKIFIKDEFSFDELTSPLTGIVYVQPDEKYFIKCSHCEVIFKVIEKFTKHCVEYHHESSISLPPVEIENISGNPQEIFEFADENLNAIKTNEFLNVDPFTHNGLIKMEQSESGKGLELLTSNTEFGNKPNIKYENLQDKSEQKEICQTKEANKKQMFNDLKCEICQKQLMSRSGYLRHIKRQTCGISTVFEINTNVSYKCKICAKEFTKNKYLQSHEIKHQKADILTCTHCKTEFRHKKNFLAHIKTHSETETLHKCEICLKEFRTNYKLKCHTMSVHSSEPFYKCNQCSEAFHSSHKLREHKSDFHNGPPKHKCPYCPKSFIRLCDLQVHERVHTGEKPYQCEICGRGFSAVHLLTNHNKRHTNERNYKCDICGKCFFTAGYLRDHMVTHTKIKSFSCEICDTRFTLRTALLKHRKLHSGVKQYVCKLCGKAYSQSPGLYAHMKTHKLAKESI